MKLISDAPQEIDEFVGAFEAVRHRQLDVDLSEFVPSRNHPLYRDVVVEVIRVDLEHSWRQGSPKKIADYRQIFADVLADKNCLEPVAFEEYRLRRISGEPVTREQYQQSYDLSTEAWPDLPLGQVCEGCSTGIRVPLGDLSLNDDESVHRHGLLSFPNYRLPEVGERFLDFELVSELGRGALGRVYLARQGDLARRFVALKITAQGCEEAQRLAQLQHTNIVPIYSFHRRDLLQAVCMPFLGRRTLADVVHSYRCGQPFPDSGQAMIGTLGVHFASTLSTDQSAEEQAAAIESQCRMLPRTEVVRRIENMSFIDAAAWMISRVADGLAHAHEHGIIHRDLKPANILLSDDGEPLILDFHLSAHRADEAVHGGTLPYMSVEQLSALQDAGEIGPQSDIYSLGVILFELLTGTTPYPIRLGTYQHVLSLMLEDRRQPAPSVRALNRRVSSDLASIVAKCLATTPAQRYQSARQLNEDLVLHLEHRSLRHASNRSLVERGRKWVRRHPRVFSATSMALFSTTVVMAMAVALSIYAHRLSRANAFEVAHDIQVVLDVARTTLNTPLIDRQSLEQSAARVRRVLDKHRILTSRDLDALEPFKNIDRAQRGQMKQDTAELLYLLASGTGQLAQMRPTAEFRTLIDEALRLNAMSQEVLEPRPPGQAVLRQRNRLSEAAGMKAPISESALPPLSASDPRDLYLLAGELAGKHDFQRASEQLEKLGLTRSQDPIVWFSLGGCYFALGKFADAESCFDTVIVLRHDLLAAYEFRGLAKLMLEMSSGLPANIAKLEDSRRDFDRVIAARPNKISALVSRSVVFEQLGRCDEAIQDLSAAMAVDDFPTRLYFLRAKLRNRTGDKSGAAEDLAAGMRVTPNDEASWIARGVARMTQDCQGALSDFEQALKLNPSSIQARQNIAHVYSERLNRPEEAITVLNEMLELKPDDPQTLVNRGVLSARLQRRAEAVADAAATMALTQEPVLIYQCACIYAITTRTRAADADTAIRLFGQALNDDVKLCRIAVTDADLEPIRTRPEFQTILNAALTLHKNE